MSGQLCTIHPKYLLSFIIDSRSKVREIFFYMNKRLAFAAAALVFSLIPFASIEEAKTADSLKEVEYRLKNLKHFHLYNGTFHVECWNQNNFNDGG